MQSENGRLLDAKHVATDHFDDRPDPQDISLLVIHNISLPPGQFDHDYVEKFFAGLLDPSLHPVFAEIYQMRVSAHCYIRRDGEIVQFVPFHKRAWHAGVSSFQGRSRCNDFSIGIEMAGTDSLPYTSEQYASLLAVSRLIMHTYPKVTLGRVVGHQDIAPGRKTDPGVAFDWARFRTQLTRKT